MIKKILRELYLLPRGEQRALLLLSLLLILGIIARATVQLLPHRPPPGMEEFVQESRAIMAAFERMDSLSTVTGRSPVTRVTGHSPVTPVTGRSPLSTVTPVTPVTRVTARSPPSPLSQPIDLNRADSVQLLPLPGIGPVFAGRIIRYRNLLGGFVRVVQLREVYGLPDETIELISDRITIDSMSIRKICLDSASFRELLRHPYLQFEDVKALVEYRGFKGYVNSVQELYENHILSDSTLQRIGPYFDLER